MSFDSGGATTGVPSVAPSAEPDVPVELDAGGSEDSAPAAEPSKLAEGAEPTENAESTENVEPTANAESTEDAGSTEDGEPAASAVPDGDAEGTGSAHFGSNGDAVPHGAAAKGDTVTSQLTNGLTCELPAGSPLAKLLKSQRTWIGPTAKERLGILRRAKSVAIVGASPNAARSSYFVGTYLQQSSAYRVYFVNPNADTILGQPAYPDLASLPEVPDIVDVFRKASDIPSVIDDVLAVGALHGRNPAVWVQLGIWNQDAALYGESKGLTVVMDRCIKVEHARFNGGLHLLGFDTGVISSRTTVR